MPILKDISTKYSTVTTPVVASYHDIALATWNKKSHSVYINVEGFASAPVEGEVPEKMIENTFSFPVPPGTSLSNETLEQLLLTTEIFLGGTII